jgi:anaerobic ribonucleoside-triphosphate reductase activating protein
VKDVIYISHYVSRTHVLGPYERSAFWVQGCPFNCDGCLSPEMRGVGGTAFDCRALAAELLSAGTEGVTISGGEPFAQAGAAARVIASMRERADRGLIVYTGYTYEELSRAGDADVAALLAATDILVDGRYRIDLDDGRPYRGSSNQRVLRLSDRYDSVFDSYYNTPGGRRVEIDLGPGRVTLTGVPSAAALKVWEKMRSIGGTLAQIAP